MRLLNEWYKRFVRGGANLAPDAAARLQEINQKELSLLGWPSANNILKETNAFELVILDQERGPGRPARAGDGHRGAKPRRTGHEGKWEFTIHKPSLLPFLQLLRGPGPAATRCTRPTPMQGNHGDEYDNKKILAEIVTTAPGEGQALLGYSTYADYALEQPHGQGTRQGPGAAEPAVGGRPARGPGEREAAAMQQSSTQRAATSSCNPGTGGTTPKNYARLNSTWTRRRFDPTSSWKTSSRAPSRWPESSTA